LLIVDRKFLLVNLPQSAKSKNAYFDLATTYFRTG